MKILRYKSAASSTSDFASAQLSLRAARSSNSASMSSKARVVAVPVPSTACKTGTAIFNGTVAAVTGMNATDNPAPGVGVLRALRNAILQH